MKWLDTLHFNIITTIKYMWQAPRWREHIFPHVTGTRTGILHLYFSFLKFSKNCQVFAANYSELNLGKKARDFFLFIQIDKFGVLKFWRHELVKKVTKCECHKTTVLNSTESLWSWTTQLSFHKVMYGDLVCNFQNPI